MAQAVRLVAAGDAQRSDAAYETAVTLRPWDSHIALLAATAYSQVVLAGGSAANDLATKWSARAVEQLPGSIEAAMAQAIAQEFAGDLSAAKATYDRLTLLSRNDPDLLLRRGVVLAQLKEYSAAESDMLAAAALAPKSPDPWLNLVTLYNLQGLSEMAAKAQTAADSLR